MAGILGYEHHQLSQLSTSLAATADKESLDALLTRLGKVDERLDTVAGKHLVTNEDFRAGHARNFLGRWNGKLVCDDFAGYKAGFEKGITEIGCMAHARRKFFDLRVANKSQLAEQALYSIGGLYEVERQARDMSDEDRWRIRQEKAAPIIKTLHDWMLAQRDLVPNGTATAKALDYSLKRWVALTRCLDDGAVPIEAMQYNHTHTQ